DVVGARRKIQFDEGLARGRHLFPQRLRQPQAQRVELDETSRVPLIVDLVFLEGDVREAIEALRRFAPDDPRRTLVELQPYRALDMFLALVDQRLEHLALGREPEAVIDQLGIARHQLVLQMRGVAVERDAFDAAMRGMEDGAARRLVNAARLHADEAVLDQIEPADAMLAAELVEPRQQRRRRQRLAVDRNRVTVLELDLDIFRLVGRGLGRDAAAIDELLGLDPRVFEHFAFGRNVQQVGVGRERRLAALVARDRNLMFLGVLDQFGPRGQIPFAPRRDHLDVGLQRVIGQLEPNLIVAFAGRAMRHRVGADLLRDLDLALGDQRPRDRGAEEILPLIQRVGAEHREDVVAHESLAQIFDKDLRHAHCLGLVARRRKFLALPNIGGKGYDFGLIGLLQPAQNHRRVEAAGIGQNDLFYVVAHGARFYRAGAPTRKASYITELKPRGNSRPGLRVLLA